MALILEALRVCQHPRHHAAHGIRHSHGRDFPAGEHKISQGDFLVHALINKALVDALIVTADQNQIVHFAQANGIGLLKCMAAGGEIHGVHRPCCLVADGFPAAIDGVRLHNGPPAAAVGVVIHLVLLVGCVVPNLVGLNPNEPPFLSPAQDALRQHIPQRVRKQGQNINPHRFPCPPAAEPPSGWLPYPRPG